jgi:hypothetical protein
MRTVDRHTGVTIDLPDERPAGWTVVDHRQGFEVPPQDQPDHHRVDQLHGGAER